MSRIALVLAASLSILLTACSSATSGTSSTPSQPTQPPVITPHNQWTWISGSIPPNTLGVPGVYGTLGAASASNVPGARVTAGGFSDSAGNLWIFGGYGSDTQTTGGELNDLWKFNPTTSQWTWMGGSNTVGASSVYGTRGVSASANVPGARSNFSTWTDGTGRFWLFGGAADTSYGTIVSLNELWVYDPALNTWTWMGGSTTPNVGSTFGSLGVFAIANFPGGRGGSATWTDKNGNLWLLGGYGFYQLPLQPGLSTGDLNDLWQFNVKTQQWAWMGGSTQAGSAGVYGVKGSADVANIPPAREQANSWTDATGNFWLFGGLGFDASGLRIRFNDLWEFSPSSLQWTWVSGSNVGNDPGAFGTQGTPAASNAPSARYESTAWASGGKLWLFGGAGDFTLNSMSNLNDLWSFDLTTKQWTWVSGSNQLDQAGVYGTKGTAASTNLPGAQRLATSLTTPDGNLWLFAGVQANPSASGGTILNDLWRYQP